MKPSIVGEQWEKNKEGHQRVLFGKDLMTKTQTPGAGHKKTETSEKELQALASEKA